MAYLGQSNEAAVSERGDDQPLLASDELILIEE